MTIVIDGSGIALGRLSSYIAKKLLKGEKIEVVNSEKVIITGNWNVTFGKYKRRFDLTSKSTPLKSPKHSKMPHLIVKRAVRGMLPWRKTRGKDAYKNLRVHIGKPTEFEGKEIHKVENIKSSLSGNYCSVGDLSKAFGMSW